MTNIDKHQPGTPSWFDLMTTDIEKARAFYTSIFGWQYEIHGDEMGKYSMAQVGGRQAAGIGQMPPGAPFPSAWTVYFNVDSVDATADAVKSNGGNVMMGPMDVADEGRLLVASDPTGAVFGCWQPKKHGGAQIRDVHGTMGWQECHTRDADRARDFYARVFKLEPVKLDDGSGMAYWTLNRGKDMHGGIYHNTQLPAQVPNHWLLYFCVDDTDRAVSAIKSGGGNVMQEPVDTPYGRMAVVTDPFGAAFAVIKPAKK